jgi:ketosteroid isomerase-like protein
MALNIEENKALVRRFFAAVASGDLTVFDQRITTII